MAVRQLSKSTIAQGLPRGSKFWDQVSSLGDFESISTVTVGAGGASTITFSSIPATYTHLQIRGISRTNRSGAGQENLYFSFNSDTAANYSQHGLYSDGSSAAAYGGGGTSGDATIVGFTIDNDVTTGAFGAMVVDILDYANTSKYKTLRTLSGYDSNGAGYVALNSANWRSTSAITTIKFSPSNPANSFLQYSTFALYGIKAA